MKDTNQSSAILILALVFACLALTIAVYEMVRPHTQYMMVDAGEAFVYPAGDQILLVMPDGPYHLHGQLTSGCYRLDPPANGADYGTATRVGEACK